MKDALVIAKREMFIVEPEIVWEACKIVNSCIEGIDLAIGVQRLLLDNGSRFTCRCRSCRATLEKSEEWLGGIKGPENTATGLEATNEIESEGVEAAR